MNKSLVAITLSLLITLPSLLFANDVDSSKVSINPSVVPPKYVLESRSAIANYLVTNGTSAQKQFNFNNYSSAVTVNSAVDNACQLTSNSTFFLPANSQCALSLKILGATNVNVIQSPTVTYASSVNPNTIISLAGFPILVTKNLPNDAPTVSVTPKNLMLTPGEKTSVTVTNDTLTNGLAINNLQFKVPYPYNMNFSKIDASACQNPDLKAGAKCTINLTVLSDAQKIIVPQKSITVDIYGANSHTTGLQVNFFKGKLSAPAVRFLEAGPKNMVITNNSNAAMSVTNLQLCSGDDSNLTGVTVSGTEVPSACQQLKPGASCNYPMQASSNAYGKGCAELTYSSPLGDSNLLKVPVSVADTSVLINHDNRIVLNKTSAPQTFTIQNTGKFEWLNPKLTLSKLSNITMSTTCNKTIAVGGFCTVNFTVPNSATKSESGVLIASGTNLEPSNKNVTLQAISIIVSVSNPNQLVQSQVIKITNGSNDAIPLQKPKITYLNNNTNALTITPLNCNDAKNIAPHSSCSFSVSANQNSFDNLGSSIIAKLSVSAGPLTSEFNVTFNNFVLAVSSNENNNHYSLTQFNSSSFSGTSISKTTFDNIYDLILFNNNVYIAADGLWLWNGKSLKSIQFSGTNAPKSIRSLAIFKDQLYLGLSNGQLGVLSADGNSYSIVTSKKSQLGHPINGLKVYNGKLFLLGGTYTHYYTSGDSITRLTSTEFKNIFGGKKDFTSSIRNFVVGQNHAYFRTNLDYFASIPSTDLKKTIKSPGIMLPGIDADMVLTSTPGKYTGQSGDIFVVDSGKIISSKQFRCENSGIQMNPGLFKTANQYFVSYSCSYNNYSSQNFIQALNTDLLLSGSPVKTKEQIDQMLPVTSISITDASDR